MDVLFLLKKSDKYFNVGDEYSVAYSNTLSSGLFNSVNFVSDMINTLGYVAGVEICFDGNEIDKFLTLHRPSLCIIEALWVTPEKIAELKHLHPNVKMVVRLHSEMPFLAQEGIAMDWMTRYNIPVATNSKRLRAELHSWSLWPSMPYLPNFYPVTSGIKKTRRWDTLRVGCFGAIRPLKNQLLQAVAAMRYAEAQGLRLDFYINGTRPELQGDNVLKNLRFLFKGIAGMRLVEIPWLEHDRFVDFMATDIDVLMQVSFTETYNIVAADAVNAGIPVVASDEIAFISPIFHAQPQSGLDIERKLGRAIALGGIGAWFNKKRLIANSARSRKVWKSFLEKMIG